MNDTPVPEGLITNIQRFSIHDGPGIRSTVFMKGCNLRCFWCHNPEDMRPYQEIQFFPERCIACEACADECPHHAHIFTGEGVHVYMRELCTACGTCISQCFANGLVMVGTRVTADQVMAEVMQDVAFYHSSGGGVTLSGGEPLLQLDFACAVLDRCREAGISTAIETAANLAWSRLATILPRLDLVMMDIKHMDSATHQEVTGVPNERILTNAKRLGRQRQPLIVRTPVIPGVNDNVDSIAAIAGFAARLPNLLYYELLPYHPMATSKYSSLDMDYRAAGLKTPTNELMASLASAAEATGITVRVG
jgi:pyruvate formate lyase activating enzyme